MRPLPPPPFVELLLSELPRVLVQVEESEVAADALPCPGTVGHMLRAECSAQFRFGAPDAAGHSAQRADEPILILADVVRPVGRVRERYEVDPVLPILAYLYQLVAVQREPEQLEPAVLHVLGNLHLGRIGACAVHFDAPAIGHAVQLPGRLGHDGYSSLYV